MSDQAERDDDVARASRDHITIGRRTTVISAAGLLAALATSSCCLLPFLFVTVGVSGAWIGNLTALAPFQPIFFLLTVVLVGSAST